MDIRVLNENWGDSRLEDIKCVLDSVCTTFEPCFGENCFTAKIVTVARAPLDSSPRCVRNMNLVLLNAEDRQWARFAYQFAHELCHFLIPLDVQQKMRWFEESICELASLYFLPLVGVLWEQNPPYPNWRDYSPHFKAYTENEEKKAVEFDLCFSDPSSPELARLYADEYNRPRNSFVAQALQPIFAENPTLWSCIPLLSEIPDGMDFSSSLRHWCQSAPVEYQDSIERIATLFSLSATPEFATV